MRDQSRPLSAGPPRKKAGLEDDGDSIVSFDSLGPPKPPVKYAWASEKNAEKVNHDTFHRMLDEYRDAKRREGQLELKAKQLAAQLARTEEAAKRALVQTDVTAKGGAAQKLLDAERALFKMRDENVELRGKLSRATKRASDLKTAHDENKKRLDAALKDQRLMARKVGDLERKNKTLVRKPEDEFWGEEAGRRFVVQQEELVLVHEENMRLKKQLAQGAGGRGAGGAAAAEENAALASQIEELTSLVRFYEKKISTMSERLAVGGGAGSTGPGPDDWVLEDLTHDGSLYLVDPRTNKMFTVPSGNNSYPRPVGMRLPSGIKLGSNSRMDRFICTLDSYCQASEQRLEEVFHTFDTSGDGQLDRSELGRFLLQLMPDMDSSQVEVMRCMLDLDGDGQVTLPELAAAIKEAYAARNAAKTGRSVEVNEVLGGVRDVLQQQRSVVREAFASMDTDGDGCLSHMDVVRLVRRLVPGLSQREVRYLLTKVLDWDVAGEGKASLDDLYQALELMPVYRASQAGERGVSQGRGGGGAGLGVSYDGGVVGSALGGVGLLAPGSARGGTGAADLGGAGLRATGVLGSPGRPGAARAGAAAQQHREAYMKDRLAQLEAELDNAHTREGALEADARRVEIMRRDLAVAKARIEDLEKDYMKLDVLGHIAEHGSEDDKLRAAWETASQFKKRYMEHKAELDTIRLAAARMQTQLEEANKLLHEEHRRRFRLEDEVTRLGMETSRIKDLETLLGKERAERLKLEREYMELQNKALSAPGNGMGEVRQLRDELFGLRRDKAVAEKKEGDVRRELSAVREQLDGMQLENYKNWQQENSQLKKQVVQLQLEVGAEQAKLDVYRRAGDTPSQSAGMVDSMARGASMPQPRGHGQSHEEEEFGLFETQSGRVGSFTVGSGGGRGAGGGDGGMGASGVGFERRPDSGKNEDEIRTELIRLREVWHEDKQELLKLHKVLEVEWGQTLEAKAALEESHNEMDRLRRDLQARMQPMKRELDSKEERIRKLELQLRGAYSGVNRALRSSHMRESRSTSTPDDLSELGIDQNILELHISEASLQEDVLGRDPSTFFTFDFFMHDTQATPVMASSRPQYNTLVQYVVDNDHFLLEYLDTHVLELELNRARGWDYDAVGVARISLRQVLEDLEVGAALGPSHAYHHADVLGADGRRVGRVRYGFNFRRPLDNLLREYKAQARAQRTSEPDPRDPATTAVAMALSDPSSASYIKAIITRCEQLTLPGGAGSPARPYVWYRFPGHRDAHTTRAEHGPNPLFSDEALWPISRTQALDANLRTRELEVVVFDDAGGEHPMCSIVGVAHVPLEALSQSIPLDDTFVLVHPVTKQPAGAVMLGLSWASSLSLGRPISGAGVAATAAVTCAGSRAPSAGGLGAFGGGNVGRGPGTAPLLGGPSMPSTLYDSVAGQGVDTGLAGFEGEELREVPAQAHPPTHISVPAGFAGFDTQPRPVQLKHQPRGIATQPGIGGVGSYGSGNAGSFTLQPSTGGAGPYGGGSAAGIGGVGGAPYGGSRRPSVGPSGLPTEVTSQGLSLFDQENLQARQLLEEQAYTQQRLQQQQQGALSKMIGSGLGSAAQQQLRGAYDVGLEGGLTGPGGFPPAPGLSAQPPVLKPYSNLWVGQQPLGVGQQPSLGGSAADALAAAPSHLHPLPLQQQPQLQLSLPQQQQQQQQPQHLHFQGLQKQPLSPAFSGQGGGRGGGSGLGSAPAAIPRVPSNRFGGQGTPSGLGSIEPPRATPLGAQEYGLSSEMTSPDPSATPGGGSGSVRLLTNVPPPRSGDGAGRYASLGGGAGLSDSMSLYSATPAPTQRPTYRGPL